MLHVKEELKYGQTSLRKRTAIGRDAKKLGRIG